MSVRSIFICYRFVPAESGYAHAAQVEINNKASLEEALELYVQGERLVGDNQYRCDTCGSLVDTVKRSVPEALPPVLLVHLKRFEIDYATLTTKKITSFCSFPHHLNMLPYTKQGLAEREGGPPSPDTPLQPPGYYDYELVGVTVHTGTLDSGHYYAFVRERQAEGSAWFEFNDTHVSPYSLSSLPEDAFGGVRDVEIWDKDKRERRIERRPKPHSAYLLVYQRKVPPPPHPPFFFDPLSGI